MRRERERTLPPMVGLDTWEKICRPYPIRVWPRRLESIESFSDRLLSANAEGTQQRNHLVQAALRLQPSALGEDLWVEILAAKAHVPIELLGTPEAPELRHHDGTTCVSCKVGTGDQWMCRMCAGSRPVRLRSHLESIVCVRHHIWLGSGAAPEAQLEVGDDYLEAERAFQALRARGVVDANTLWELLHVVDPTLADEAEHHILPVTPFPTAVRLWTLLTDEKFTRRFFDPNYAYASTFEFLRTALHAAGLNHEGLDTRTWHYLRPTVLTIREWVDGRAVDEGTAYQAFRDHDFWVDPAIIESFAAPIRPLERFSRYLAASGTDIITADNWREILTHRSAGHGPQHYKAPSDGKTPGICVAGHRVVVPPVRQFADRTSYSCSYCTGRAMLPGESDITATHPGRAQYFDYKANAPLLPNQLHAKNSWNKVNWICAKGHPYVRAASSQCLLKEPCFTCDDLEPLEGFNTIADKQPEIAREWHPTLNAQSAKEVTLRTAERAWLICPYCGKPFDTDVKYRYKNGPGCKPCNLTRAFRHTIADRFPELESQWDATLNGGLSFAEAEGLHIEFTWVCIAGHAYPREAAWRSRHGCPLCTGHVKSDTISALVERYPLITSEFHPTKNRVTKYQMNARFTYVWLCKYGHTRETTLHNRRQSGGCGSCPLERRVAYDTPEQTPSQIKRLQKMSFANLDVATGKTIPTRLRDRVKGSTGD